MESEQRDMKKDELDYLIKRAEELKERHKHELYKKRGMEFYNKFIIKLRTSIEGMKKI